jgi:DNA-binding NarL/FixJ family response regulator
MKILVIDKYPVLRIGLSVSIRTELNDCVVEHTESVSTFQENKADFNPDLIIQGLNMGTNEDDLKMVNSVKKKFPHTALIIYDENLNSSLLIEYLKAGVHGYLVKRSSIDDLLDCISAVMQGSVYYNSQALIESLINSRPIIYPTTKKLNLTPHEYEIASYLSDGMTTSWIAQKKGRKI